MNVAAQLISIKAVSHRLCADLGGLVSPSESKVCFRTHQKRIKGIGIPYTWYTITGWCLQALTST